MQLTKDQRIFIVLEFKATKSREQVRRAFNKKFSERNSLDKKTVNRIMKKFNEHGSIVNRKKGNSGRKNQSSHYSRFSYSVIRWGIVKFSVAAPRALGSPRKKMNSSHDDVKREYPEPAHDH
ncbi:Protein of unknown function DUF4817 [Trinorchestia longiramus]|nr:Protein of unknown function DUF4817 [Trinorchestia longiramus]